MAQAKQSEWLEQWQLVQDDELFLFQEWIHPYTLENFKDKNVLEFGCGGGQHTAFIAPYARAITAIDLNSVEVARKRNAEHNHITFLEDDVGCCDLEKQFDVVFSIGVIHHTDDPDKTVANMIRHTAPGGQIIMWVYSQEGNWLVKHMLEPLRKLFLVHLSRPNLLLVSRLITALMYIPIYTLYLLPLPFLPFYEYFKNFRRLSFYRNALNVFDKVNAPQVQFISHARAAGWLPTNLFTNISITPYKGVSWRISGTKLK